MKRKRAYSYIRFSTLEQRRGDSLRRQLKLSQDWCDRNGYVLDDTLSLRDLGVSAFKRKNGVDGALKAFLDAVDAGRIERGAVLLVESLDRLSREAIPEALELFLGILRRGIIIVTLSPEEVFDKPTIDVTKILVALITMGRAHDESAIKSRRGGAAWEAKRSKATTLKLTAKCPAWLGLNEDRTSFERKEEAVAIVVKIFEWAIEGLGLDVITRRLIREEVPPLARANTWHRSYIRKILTNRAVLGEYHPHTGHGSRERKPVGNPLPNYYPAILTEATFYQAQASLQGRRVQRGPIGKSVANLFTGLVRDVNDSSTMVLVDKGKRSSGPKLVSSAAKRGSPGSKYAGFPYKAFEYVVLSSVQKVEPLDDTANATIREEIAESEGRLSEIEDRINMVKSRMIAEPDFTALMDVLRQLDTERTKFADHIYIMKCKIESCNSSHFHSVMTMARLALKEEAQEDIELRTRLKARLKSIIQGIWVMIDGRNATIIIKYKRVGIHWVSVVVEKGKDVVWSDKLLPDDPNELAAWGDYLLGMPERLRQLAFGEGRLMHNMFQKIGE